MADIAGDVSFIRRRVLSRRELLERLQETPLLTIVSGEGEGREAWIEEVPFRIGRGFNNHLVVPSPGVAPLHGHIRLGPAGDYVFVAADPVRAPVLSRRRLAYTPGAIIPLSDKTHLRLGEGGPVLQFRYLGGAAGRRAVLPTLLGVGQPDPLLPLPHLTRRLEEQRYGGGVSPSLRYFLDQAVRHLDQIRFYRRWMVGWGFALILLCGLITWLQIGSAQAHGELEVARSRLRADLMSAERGVGAEAAAPQVTGDEELFAGDRIAQAMFAILKESGLTTPTLDQELVNMVKSQIDLETARLRRRFDLTGFLERHDRYHPRIEEIFEREYQLPRSLAYVAWVESDYRLDAESPKGALGMWQFMDATAVDYGLITPAGEDYRLNFESSTRAAAQMFGDLLAQFGLENLLVSVAAYNWGPKRFAWLMRRNQLWRPGQRSFAHMLKLKTAAGDPAIPAETRDFVARFFAVHIIADDLAYYLGGG